VRLGGADGQGVSRTTSQHHDACGRRAYVGSVAGFVGESQVVLAGYMAHAILHESLRMDFVVILRCG
jgi:hypothetical protein